MKPGKVPPAALSPIIQEEEPQGTELGRPCKLDRIVKFTDLTGHSPMTALETIGRWYGVWQPAAAAFPRRVPGSGWVVTATHLRRTVESVVSGVGQKSWSQSRKKGS